MRFDLLALSAFAPLVAAHGAVTSYIIDGTTYPGYEGFSPASSPKTIQFQWPNYDPTMTVSDAKMRCNGGTSAQLSATVQAGSNVTAVWKQWTHEQGPVQVWLFKCPGAFGSSCKGDGKGWFKIDEMGMWGGKLNSANWGTALIVKNHQWSSEIPKNMAPGNYLIRHELLALHQANTPQFYAECAQIVVQGSGNAVPPSDYLYSIPTYAPQNDPGVTLTRDFKIDIYSSKATTYTPPGGRVWSGFQF
uniref:lytic cellulose monooxygenase (C4-dehydrogenating) n=1 Tax=Neurospora crassa TaxID=5141 RepID=Q9P3R7_NEUCS|nr:related to cel1 protein precursor [Neurospora crassa]